MNHNFSRFTFFLSLSHFLRVQKRTMKPQWYTHHFSFRSATFLCFFFAAGCDKNVWKDKNVLIIVPLGCLGLVGQRRLKQKSCLTLKIRAKAGTCWRNKHKYEYEIQNLMNIQLVISKFEITKSEIALEPQNPLSKMTKKSDKTDKRVDQNLLFSVYRFIGSNNTNLTTMVLALILLFPLFLCSVKDLWRNMAISDGHRAKSF